MGVLRLVLALSVVLDHLGVNRLVGGPLAVQVFYMISGFYMALVLHERYVPGKTGDTNPYWAFLQARLLRLLPTYYVVLGATLLWELMARPPLSTLHYWAEYAPRLGIGSVALLMAPLIALFGQDLVVFAAVRPSAGGLFLTPAFRAESLPAWHLMFVPPAWSLGVELAFYLVAPFLVRRRPWVLAALMAGSLSLRAWAYTHGLNHDPWTYRFFPFELVFFLAGACGYRVSANWKATGGPSRPICGALTAALLSVLFAYPKLPGSDNAKMLLLLTVAAVALPFAFHLTRRVAYDRLIGELSYPLYLVHWVIIRFMHWLGHENHYLVAAVALLAAIAVMWGVDMPVARLKERMRVRRETARPVQAVAVVREEERTASQQTVQPVPSINMPDTDA